MDLHPDAFEIELVNSAGQMLARHGTLDAVRRAHSAEDGLIPGLWDAAVEQGWFLLAAPESTGGLGGALYQSAMILERIGQTLVPGPWVGSFVAAALLGDAYEGRRAREGARVALALDFRGEDCAPHLVDGALGGRCPVIHDAQSAEALLVDVQGELWWVERPALTPLMALDPGLRLASVSLEGAVGRPLGIATRDILAAVDILVAAQAVGVAEGAFQMARAFALTREQFGKPIGGFQAIKHRLADGAARVEQASALATIAAVRVSEGGAPASAAASAWHLAVTNARANANDALLIHGAMGFTWECDAHLFLKRAHSLGEFRRGLGEVLDDLVAEALA